MIKVIDTHIHFWNPSVLRYPWLETDDWKHLSDTFEPADFERDCAQNVVAAVHVQAEMDHTYDPVRETAWLDSHRQRTDAARPTPTVAVGYADLTRPDLPDVLDRHQAFDYFRGVRQEAWYDPASTMPDLHHAFDLLAHPEWLNGLKELARRGLTFDLLVYAHQLRLAADIFAKVPDLPVVLDHLGHPPSAADHETWRADLAYFKERVPKAHMKLSGLSFIAPTLDDPAVRGYVLDAVDIFGPDRCMAGSNYPVDKSAGTYAEIWSAMDRITGGLSDTDRSKIFRQTAAAFYGIELSAEDAA